ncbi:MAG TPA: DUF4254 domain-containing protein [Acidisarcina sp.]
MLSAQAITSAHDHLTALWHAETPSAQDCGTLLDTNSPWPEFANVLAGQHLANFKLWHAEDDARSPGATDHDIVGSKRYIDKVNQQRNDLAERCDLLLMEYLRARDLPQLDAPLHSETPGLMIDRLSILSLKLFHTAEEITRPGAPAGHAERNRSRYAILLEQRGNLANCLDELWSDILCRRRRIHLYQQLKMYNDPELNPRQYNARTSG